MTLADLGRLLVPKCQKCPGEHKRGMFGSYSLDCHGTLILRMNRTTKDVFWGCSDWPQCRYGKPFNEHEMPYEAKLALYTAARRRPRKQMG